jgi:hypothetical protein
VKHEPAILIKARTMSEDEHTEETVKEAAEHAARSVEHRRQMQRSAAKAQDADRSDQDALEREAAEHEAAAGEEEDEAQETAREADRES